MCKDAERYTRVVLGNAEGGGVVGWGNVDGGVVWCGVGGV